MFRVMNFRSKILISFLIFSLACLVIDDSWLPLQRRVDGQHRPQEDFNCNGNSADPGLGDDRNGHNSADDLRRSTPHRARLGHGWSAGSCLHVGSDATASARHVDGFVFGRVELRCSHAVHDGRLLVVENPVDGLVHRASRRHSADDAPPGIAQLSRVAPTTSEGDREPCKAARQLLQHPKGSESVAGFRRENEQSEVSSKLPSLE